MFSIFSCPALLVFLMFSCVDSFYSRQARLMCTLVHEINIFVSFSEKNIFVRMLTESGINGICFFSLPSWPSGASRLVCYLFKSDERPARCCCRRELIHKRIDCYAFYAVEHKVHKLRRSSLEKSENDEQGSGSRWFFCAFGTLCIIQRKVGERLVKSQGLMTKLG